MKRSDFIWNELIYGGHWLSLGGSAFVFSMMILLQLPLRWDFLPIIYLLFQFVFSYNHYKELDNDAISALDRTDHLKKYEKYLLSITCIYGFGFIVLLIYFGNIESIIFGVLLALFGFLFTTKFKKYTINITGFKTIYASFLFSLFIVFTALFCSYQINLRLIEIFLFMFLRLMVSSSFSDIKDIESDKQNNLSTLPVFFGKQKFLFFLHILNFVTILPLFFTVIQIQPSFSFFVIFSYFYEFYYILKAKNPEADIQSLTNVLVDGEFIFWPFLLFLGIIFAF